MEFVERISGGKALDVFRRLREEYRPLRILVLDLDYDRLTIVTGVEIHDGRPFLLVDQPWDFEEIVPEPKGKRVRLEFKDRKLIPHSCQTVISHVADRDLWLESPVFVERTQRRRHFRVEPPQGTKLVWNLGGVECEAYVINISLGGNLVISPAKAKEKGFELQPGDSLKDLRLMAKKGREGEQLEISVKRALVKRVERGSEGARMTFALQFLDLERAEEQALEGFIYYCQRRLLRKRSGLAGGLFREGLQI